MLAFRIVGIVFRLTVSAFYVLALLTQFIALHVLTYLFPAAAQDSLVTERLFCFCCSTNRMTICPSKCGHNPISLIPSSLRAALAHDPKKDPDPWLMGWSKIYFLIQD